MKALRGLKFSIILLIALSASLSATDLRPLQKALRKYDPIVKKNIELNGKLHFPEVESKLPDFYKQLFKRVFIQLSVGRSKFKVDIGGESEQLKDLVRQHFLKIEEKLKGEFLEVMENDPIYRLKNVGENPLAYSTVVHERHASKEYHFNVKIGIGKKHKLPKAVMFELSEKGRLEKMVVEDKRSVAEFTFTTEMVDKKYYISRIDMIYKRHGIEKHRKLEVVYDEKEGIRFPTKLTMSELDSQGNLLIVPGHLNPVSMVFDTVSVLPKEEKDIAKEK